jgi:hypothetical protein
MTPEHFVTADDVAAHLKITRRQVLELTRRRIIPAHPLGTGEHRRIWRYKISEVDAAISSGAREPRTPTQRTMSDGSPRSQRRISNG